MKTTPTLSFAAVAFALMLPAFNSMADNVRVRESLNNDWRFIKGDPADAGTNLSYATAKPWLLPMRNAFTTNAPVARPSENLGGDIAFAQPGFDDRGWRKLNLPHDFGIEGPFQQALPGETGKLPWFGVAWYRKQFDLPAGDAGKQIYLDVDGAMAYATVWINGHCAGGWPYGYASWRVDLTPFVKFGGTNTLAIRLDNPKDSSRWYPGGGIYRNVWLVKTAPVALAQNGVYVTTPEIKTNEATVHIEMQIENKSGSPQHVDVINYILAPGEKYSDITESGKIRKSWLGTPLAPKSTLPFRRNSQEPAPYATIEPGASVTLADDLVVKAPKLWSVGNPNLYRLVTRVYVATDFTNGVGHAKLADEMITPFGIRTIQFTVDDGFLLNGERVRINGVCNHADLGALGSAVNTRGLERQLEILRELGVNAIRTSHNPPAPELLDLCDRLGFLVMDEAFDCWAAGKKKNDYHILYSDWHEADLRALVRRDRNHPCVILWSSGNEVPDQDKPAGPALAEEHRNIIHSEDPTRPCTAAVSSTKAGFSGFQNHFDVFGWNYRPQSYANFHTTNSSLPLFGSETSSTVSSRGEYFFPMPAQFETKNIRHTKNDKTALADFQVSSYDYFVPGWATTPDMEWAGEERNPFVAGEFVWTGFDYLGEPTPYNADVSNLLNYSNPADKEKAKEELDRLGKIRVPSRSSYFGIVDLAGFKKDRFYLYQSHWRPELPMAHILPHWNWPERVGLATPVLVYTSGDEAELFLNGQSLGRKKKGQFEYRLRWDDAKYAPGELKVVAYKNGKKWATDEVRTTGPAAKLLVKADRERIAADGKDLSFVTVTVADTKGQLVPRSKNHIRFEIEGPGEILAVDNGDATSFEPFQASERNAYNGLALVIVRATQPGKITLKAHADGLKDATTRITAQ